MAEEIRVKLGRKPTPEEEKNIDKTKAGTMTPTPRAAGVAGQEVEVHVRCPYCGAMGHFYEAYPHNEWVECWNCHQWFEAIV